MKLLPVLAVLACCVGSGCTTLPVARCKVDLPSSANKVVLSAIYPNRHSQLAHVVGNLFVDIKYSSFTSTVHVIVVRAPHFPWSFGEKVIGEEVALHMNDREGLKIGELKLDALEPRSELICSEEAK